ncbi:stemmadenine O-acetyltransferase-like [Wolffia australiana]
MEDIVVVSEETIKPSSPTPPEKAVHKLSMLDQLAPEAHISLIFFYTHGLCSEETLPRLRTSLSETLSIYYPLAGRRKDKLFLSCNDEGAVFLEARVAASLSSILSCRDVAAVDKLLPCLRSCAGDNDEGLVAAFQVNFFSCGSVALGACVSHKVLDGLSLCMFLKTWAAISRNGGAAAVISPPSFDAAEIFPPLPEVAFSTVGLNTGELATVTKVFLFDGTKLLALRAKEKMTRVEAASAMVWRCVIRSQMKETSTKASVATQVVNLRRRLQPPLPDSALGNLWVVTLTDGFIPYEQRDLDCLTITQMTNAMKTVPRLLTEANDSLQDGGLSGVQKIWEDLLARYSGCGVELCCFSSFCGFPVYEVDFGWGKPSWVARGSLYFRNSVTLMPARKREGEEEQAGMEAWVSLGREEMSRFEKDPELLSLLSSVSVLETQVNSLRSTEESSGFLSSTQLSVPSVAFSDNHQSSREASVTNFQLTESFESSFLPSSPHVMRSLSSSAVPSEMIAQLGLRNESSLSAPCLLTESSIPKFSSPLVSPPQESSFPSNPSRPVSSSNPLPWSMT